VSGPPVLKEDTWFKESKVIYSGIKKKVLHDGNTVELFPKKNYREKLDKRRKIKHSLSSKELLEKYEDINELLKELVDLILKRRDEIVIKNQILNEYLDKENLDTQEDDEYWESNSWDTHIHLRAHGLGSELLHMLNYSKYSKLIGSMVTFDGIEYDYSELDYAESYSEDIVEYNTIINITVNKISEISDEYWLPDIEQKYCGCSNKKFFATVGGILGTVGGILALI